MVAATALVAAGVLLTMLPMRSVFTDWSWLIASVGCVLPYVVIVAAFRAQRTPAAWQVLLGLAGSVLALCWVYVPQHLYLGVVPTWASVNDVHLLIQDAHRLMQGEHAPLASTPSLRLLVASATVLLVALADVLGILLRRPLLAAAPLLEVLAVASATSSRAASPVYFAAAAVGFLLILIACTRLQDRAWGPSVDGSAGRLGGARRMAVTGIVAALIVPLALPSVSSNLLARATHHDGNGDGSGGSGRIVLNNAADLQGSLRRGNPVDLFKVQVAAAARPFYVRQVVLDQLKDSGWVESATENSRQVSLFDRQYPIEPARTGNDPSTTKVASIQASFTILRLGGDTLPILANPSDLQAGGGGDWDASTATVSGIRLTSDTTYTERADQPAPTEDELRAAPDWTSSGDPGLDNRYLGLPSNLPASIGTLATSLTDGKTSAYDKARAISDYFTDTKNGFVYSLDTAPADGTNALASFLKNKRGFCQQYAAAAAALMREAKIPARVVLGYTHQAPDDSGEFTVTTADAHAWVEAYFTGIGWVAFDPTPLSGSDAGRVVALPWAPHPGASATASVAEPTAKQTNVLNPGNAVPTRPAAAQAAGGNSVGSIPWRPTLIGLGVLLALGLLVSGPHLVRRRQRTIRFRQARASGNPESLWRELAATATDRGTLWPDTLTVGQVPAWLAKRGIDDRGGAVLSAVAVGVERSRFSASGQAEISPDLIQGVDQALKRWSRRAERRQRVMNWWLPRSVLTRGGSQPR
jgi:transglutaminase-like putative cysteine protease